MIEERIQKSQSAVETAGNISPEKKAELLGLLSKLESAIAEVSQTHREDAHSVARLVEASTHEATRAKKKPELTRTVLRGLKQSVGDFEASHPQLVALINEYATVLASMGL